MIEGKLTIDIKFAIIKELEYQPSSFQYQLTFFNVDKPMFVSISTVENIKPDDVYVEYSNGSWELLPKDIFNERYVPNKVERKRHGT